MYIKNMSYSIQYKFIIVHEISKTMPYFITYRRMDFNCGIEIIKCLLVANCKSANNKK